VSGTQKPQQNSFNSAILGPGTELRRPLGITIIGDLSVSQILTL
jgi:multidrug efflux pump subunit AcrB